MTELRKDMIAHAVATDGADWMDGMKKKRFTFMKTLKNLKNQNLKDLSIM